jgi:diadenosine tetraphosphatase ApaH/serine/threonine PP2A family protein phosphatase
VEFSQVIKESKTSTAEDFHRLIEETRGVLCSENDALGNLTVIGRLAKLAPVGTAVVVGDLHGDLESLTTILKNSRITQRMAKDKDTSMVFLGDYGDRGVQSTEVFYVILKLKLTFPRQVAMLRGNHEGPSDLMASPHDLPLQLQHRFKEKWVDVYQKLTEFFSCLYNAAYVDGRYLMVHGGIPEKARHLQEIANANKLHPEKTFLEELLWNDPEESIKGTYPSPRGAGKLFSKAVTQEGLEKLNAQILIRGHEPSGEGFKINHDGKVLTLFSRKGPPYYNKYGAYLDLPLSEKFENANQLIPYIHKF